MTASQTAKARKDAEKLQAKIDAANRKLQKKEDDLVAKMQAVNEERTKKIAMLEAQKATAVAESKVVLDKRLADLRSDYDGRTKRLQEAVNRRKESYATSVA